MCGFVAALDYVCSRYGDTLGEFFVAQMIQNRTIVFGGGKNNKQ